MNIPYDDVVEVEQELIPEGLSEKYPFLKCRKAERIKINHIAQNKSR